MSINQTSMYDVDRHIAEVFDENWMTEATDIEHIRGLIAGQGPLRILEPFCGTGRVLLPLAQEGHELVGMDRSQTLLGRLREKLSRLPEDTQRRVTLIEADVTALAWPKGFDMVFMGGNCLYELASAEEQAHCIAAAAAALKPGGYLYLDNDHMEGELAEGWRRPGRHRHMAPFTCADGVVLEFESETIWYDAPGRLHRGRRVTRATYPDGHVAEQEFVIQKHPPCLAELRAWLGAHGFVTEQCWETEGRATYWARLCSPPGKESQENDI